MAALILVGLAIAIYAPIMAAEIWQSTRPSDYVWHLNAVTTLGHGELPDSYFMFQLLVYGINLVLGGDNLNLAALLVVVAAEVAYGLVLFFGLFGGSRPGTPWQIALRLVAVLGAMIAFDVPIMFLFDGHLYMGQVGLVSYHNPTIILLKPFAAAQFVLCAKALERKATEGFSSWRVAGLAVLTILSGLAKPSFQICLLPATGLAWLFFTRDRRLAVLKVFLPGLWIPAVALLAWQFSVEFNGNTSSILWAPLLVFLHDSAAWTLLPKLVSGIAFPLAMLVAFRRQIFQDKAVLLGWLLFPVAMFYAYFLAEPPPGTFDGNFGWGLETCGTLLFAASTRLYVTELLKRTGNKLQSMPAAMLGDRFRWPTVFFVMQVASGVIWYIDSIRPTNHW